jgi:cytochrome c556
MSNLEQRRADRLRIMKSIYEQTGDNTRDYVDLWEIRAKLDLTDDEMGNAVDWLEAQRLIEALRTGTGQRTPMHAQITHRGVVEMERSETEPEQPTEHFPPLISIVNVGGDMIGSAINSGSPGATQYYRAGDISVGTDSKKAIVDFMAEFEAKKAKLEQEKTPEAVAEMAAEVATIKAQINSPKPKKHYIQESLRSVRAILENGAGGVVTSGLLLLLGHIHL